MPEGSILLSTTHLLDVLYPHVPKKVKRNNITNYLKILSSLGLKRYQVPNTRFYLCDIASLNWESNGVDLRDFIANRHKYIQIREWLRRESLDAVDWKTWSRLIHKRLIPYIRVRGSKKLFFVPADFSIQHFIMREVKDKFGKFQKSLLKIAEGNIHAIVFPNWWNYPKRLRQIFQYILAQQGRLLKVGNRYGVIVSALDYNLYDLLEKENGDISNLAYYMLNRSDQVKFQKAKEAGKVAIVQPWEIKITTRTLISFLNAAKDALPNPPKPETHP